MTDSRVFHYLTCSVCLGIFTDPVSVFCGHSFCRECITLSLKSLDQCPQCRATVPTDRMDFTTNHILKKRDCLLEARSQLLTYFIALTPKAAVGFCPEHDEKLKLFCVTDQQLTCIICRDCERHEGHKFKPIKEAAASVRKEVETLVEKESSDFSAIERLAESQNKEIRKSKEKSQRLRIQISSQFQEMQQFLKRREDEILNELTEKENDELEKMRESLNVVEKALTEGREVWEQMKSVLEITDPESFLKSWQEKGKSKGALEHVFRPRVNELQVVESSLSLGPYESHLQFFMWKEMLQVIQPWAALLTLKRDSEDVVVSDDGRSLFSFLGFSFRAGQHYWEIEVGSRNYWELGVMRNLLKYDGVKYAICGPNVTTDLEFGNRPRKIGVYFNCSSKELSFYDADTMTHIHSVSAVGVTTPVSAQINIQHKEPDHSPVTVCWY
uniref:E3 ubiquitin-protein ligase TRIM39-like n=1 Tax=Xiphophorus maculatus TaxID=8083 RepID=A0A3B5R7K4_XIPMA